MIKTIITNDAAQTRKFAEELAGEIILKPELSGGINSGRGKERKEATVIGLTGDLGSGKTAFAQGFAKALGVKEKITSPTFVIEKRYKTRNKNRKNLIHIDAYRIKDPKEILDLGWEEIAGDPKNIIIVEWAERIKKILPKKHIQINFEHMDGNKRRIKIKNR